MVGAAPIHPDCKAPHFIFVPYPVAVPQHLMPAAGAGAGVPSSPHHPAAATLQPDAAMLWGSMHEFQPFGMPHAQVHSAQHMRSSASAHTHAHAQPASASHSHTPPHGRAPLLPMPGSV
jgi:hypothetical protein